MNALELRRRTLGKGVYKKTVEGNPAIAQGSLARRYPGITMQGWTEQASTTGAQLFDYTKSEEGVLNAEGNIETGESYRTSDFIPLDSEKKYIISATGSNRGKYYNSEKKPIRTGGFSDFNPEKGTQIIPNETIAYCRFTYMKESESTIMLNEGSTLKPYEPYTGGQPSPNPDYPQEIVSAGKYDEGTGKYQYTIKISDSEESPTKSQTVLLTSDRQLTKWDKLEKRNGQWGWVYKSGSYSFDGSTDENWNVTASSTYTFIIGINGAMFINSFCDRYICMPASWVSNNFGVYSDNGYNTKYFRPPSADVETVEQWKTFLSQNPLTVVCETAEETFVPLTESEQEAMNALHTFRPTTVLSNDCECEMTLTYKTKKSLEVTT